MRHHQHDQMLIVSVSVKWAKDFVNKSYNCSLISSSKLKLFYERQKEHEKAFWRCALNMYSRFFLAWVELVSPNRAVWSSVTHLSCFVWTSHTFSGRGWACLDISHPWTEDNKDIMKCSLEILMPLTAGGTRSLLQLDVSWAAMNPTQREWTAGICGRQQS